MTVGGVTTDYAYDGTMLVREFQINQQTGLLAPSATYMVGPMGPCCRINEQNQSEGYYPAGATSSTPLTRGVTRWYVYDGLGSVVAELDDNNNMTTSGQFDVYGAPRLGTQQGVAATSSQGYVGSLGHMTDASTGGLIYMRARYYDPSLGRFVSEDPSCHGNNWFIYCGNDPVDKFDSSGRDEDLAGSLEAMGDSMGLDGSLDGLGLSELDGLCDEQADGTLNIIIEYIQNQGPASFNKARFLQLANELADEYECGSVRISGQCDPGSVGAKMFENMKNILGAAAQLGQDSDAAQLYWVLQDD
jgi:RHS repeat-associated protein